MRAGLLQVERAVLERVNAALEANQPARSLQLKPEEAAAIKALDLLTAKPMIYAANVAEGDLADQGASSPHVQAMRERAAQEGSSLVVCSAQARPQAVSELLALGGGLHPCRVCRLVLPPAGTQPCM